MLLLINSSLHSCALQGPEAVYDQHRTWTKLGTRESTRADPFKTEAHRAHTAMVPRKIAAFTGSGQAHGAHRTQYISLPTIAISLPDRLAPADVPK